MGSEDMKQCPKTTSGKHYWHTLVKSFDEGKHGKWLEGEIFVRADRECLSCRIIDDKKYLTTK